MTFLLPTLGLSSLFASADTKNIALAVPFSPGGQRPERVMVANAFVDPSGKVLSRDITMACWYDREKLHLNLEAKSAMAKADAPGPRDSNAWNGFELFIKPPNSGEFYYHLAIDANGTLYDAKVSENLGVIKGMDTKWDMAGGTVSSRLESGRHRVTLAIPFASLGAPAPAPGDGWRFNAGYGGKQWSPTYSWNHVPKQFGHLFFAGDDPVVETFAISPLTEDSGTVSLTAFAAQSRTVRLKIMATAEGGGKNFPFTIPLHLAKGENRFTAPLRIPEAGVYALSVELVDENRRLLYAATNLPRPIMPFKKTQHELVSALDDAIQRLARRQQELDDVRQAQAKVRQIRTWEELYSVTATAAYWINLSRCPGGLGYARASSTQKIYPTDVLPAADFAQPVDLCAAGGEARGAQVVVFAASALKDVAIQVSPLEEATPAIDRQAIEVGAVKYLATQPPVYAANPGFLHPDPIEPVITACALTPGAPNLFYITVNIKRGHAAGLYANKLSFTQRGKTLFSVPLRTRVFGFSLPETPSLASSIWFFRDHIRKLYNLDRPFSYEDAAPYFQFFAKYRLSLMDYPETRDNSTIPYAAVILRQDTAGNLKVAPDLINGLLSRHPYMNISFLSMARCQMPDSTERVLTADELKHATELVDDYLRNENLASRFYSLIGDEPTASSYSQVLETGRDSKQRFPSVQRVSTTHPVPELAEVVDVWCPLPRSFNPAERQHEQDAGKAFWLYTAVYSDPPYPNHYIDTAATYPRLLFWISYKYAVTGYLNWGANYWTGFQRELNRNVIKNGTFDYQAWQTSIIGNLGAANGDGYLCYPNPKSAYAEPISCLRLENMRDGLQDYEYLKMAQALAAKNGDATVKQWLELPFIKAPGEFPLDGCEIEALRIRLGEFIESSVRSSKTAQVTP